MALKCSIVVGSVAGNGRLLEVFSLVNGLEVLARKSWRLLFLSASKGERVLAGKVEKFGVFSASI
jgi:hypothetical protein